jgi:hypothetical protein
MISMSFETMGTGSCIIFCDDCTGDICGILELMIF